MKQKLLVAALVSSGLISPLAFATNGMNREGCGPIEAAMGKLRFFEANTIRLSFRLLHRSAHTVPQT